MSSVARNLVSLPPGKVREVNARCVNRDALRAGGKIARECDRRRADGDAAVARADPARAAGVVPGRCLPPPGDPLAPGPAEPPLGPVMLGATVP